MKITNRNLYEMAFPLPRAHPILPRFERDTLCYKTLGSTDFEVAVLVPKSLTSSSKKVNSPLLVHFHGGSLLMGTILDSAILSVWYVHTPRSCSDGSR
jgi:hypothetical protein